MKVLFSVEDTRLMRDHSDANAIVNGFRQGPTMLMIAHGFESVPVLFVDLKHLDVVEQTLFLNFTSHSPSYLFFASAFNKNSC